MNSSYLTKIFNIYLNRCNKRVINLADKVVFQSELSRMMLKKFIGYNKIESVVIYNGAPKEFSLKTNSKIYLEGSPILVVTATFRPPKRLLDAIFLTNHLGKKYPSIKLHVLGDIDILTLSALKTVDCSRVKFHGRLSQSNRRIL